MGLPEGWVTDPVRLLTDVQQLTALGNGVVPIQAAHAVNILLDHAGVKIGQGPTSGGFV